MQQYRKSSFRSLLWGTIIFFITGVPLFAADAPVTSGFSAQSTYLESAGAPIKYLFTSLFYIALMFGIFYILRKYFLPQNMSVPGYERFRVVRKLALEPQSALYLVQSGESVLLLGVGAKQITLIKELPKKEAHILLRPVTPAPLPSLDSFKKHLSAVMGRKK